MKANGKRITKRIAAKSRLEHNRAEGRIALRAQAIEHLHEIGELPILPLPSGHRQPEFCRQPDEGQPDNTV